MFTEEEYFSVTATPTTEGFAPTVILLDESGTELTRASGLLTSTQPAGNYFVQVEPETGEGFYTLTIRRVEVVVEPTDPASTTSVEPASVFVGESTTVSVSLDNIPADGYTSAEFTCTYDPALVSVSNIAVTNLFGEDAATAINDATPGSFIVAIAGSNGAKAVADGAAFTFTATALQVGEAAIICQARTSMGDNVLTDVESLAANLSIIEEVVILDGTFAGTVLAGKPVMVSLFDAESTLIASVAAELDGTFSVNAPEGSYTVVAESAGFLSALGTADLTAGETATKEAVALLAGEIDGKGVIDHFDAMTIGMSYNTADPSAADLNNDGNINVLDLELLAANYRMTGPIVWP